MNDYSLQCTVADMEIQSIDQGRRPQRVQNVVAASSARAHVIVDTMRPAAARDKACHGCMVSALGPLDVRPNFHVNDSTCTCMMMCFVECCCVCQPFYAFAFGLELAVATLSLRELTEKTLENVRK